MDPTLVELYTTVLGAPYVIAAYVLMWVALFIYVIVSGRNLKKTEQQIAALEEAIEQLKRKS